MTVTYTGNVPNASLKSFVKTLFRWRGSLWKAVYRELFVWCIAYTILSLVYRLALNDQQKRTFENVCTLCYKYSELIPLTFMLGFFVKLVIGRWSTTFFNMGWCDNFSLYVVGYIHGNSQRCRIMRRNIVRYMIFSQALVYRDISIKVRRRFPNLESLVLAGNRVSFIY